MKSALTQIDAPLVHQLKVAEVPVFWVPCSEELPIKIECVFEGGRGIEHKPLAGLTAHHLIKEATAGKNSQQFARAWDQVGSELFTHYYYNCCSIGFRSLYPFHLTGIDLLFECLSSPRFDFNDVTVFLEQQKQELQIDLGQAESVADRQWNYWLFGPNHPYGYLSTPALYDNLTESDLRRQHKISYQPSKLGIVLMAYDPDPAMKHLEQVLGSLPVSDHSFAQIQEVAAESAFPNPAHSSNENYIVDENIEGSALRMGDFGPGRSHLAFTGFQMLIHILGGYFGSRLIQEVREKRGLVYHIQSQIEIYGEQTLFQISADTSAENILPTEQIILQEIERLQTELVPDEELTMAKNYLKGHLLQLIDNPLKQSTWMKQLLVEGIDIQQVKEEWSQLWEITPLQIRSLAEQHLTVKTLRKLKVN